MPFKRPDLMRRVMNRSERAAATLAELRKQVRQRNAIRDMIESEGWKLFQARVQLKSAQIVAQLQSEQVKDEEALHLRHQLVGINIVQRILNAMVAEGDNAEKQLKQTEDEKKETHA